jgi:hypothetical protein
LIHDIIGSYYGRSHDLNSKLTEFADANPRLILLLWFSTLQKFFPGIWLLAPLALRCFCVSEARVGFLYSLGWMLTGAEVIPLPGIQG